MEENIMGNSWFNCRDSDYGRGLEPASCSQPSGGRRGQRPGHYFISPVEYTCGVDDISGQCSSVYPLLFATGTESDTEQFPRHDLPLVIFRTVPFSPHVHLRPAACFHLRRG